LRVMSTPKPIEVLFDTGHNDEVAPDEPELSKLGELLKKNTINFNFTKNPLTPDLFENCHVLVLGNPLDAAFTSDEISAIVSFVKSGGGLLFVKILGDEIRDKKLSVVENITLPYACRVKGPALVNVSRLIQGNFCGVFPSKRTNEILEPLMQLFPSIKPAENILEVAFYNPNVLLHPVASLFNIGRIEYSDGEFYLCWRWSC